MTSIVTQPVAARLTHAAIFLVVTLKPDTPGGEAVRALCGDLASLLRRFAASAADQDRAAEVARSATAQARFTGLLVVAMPTGAALFGELVHPGFLTRLFQDSISTAMLVAAAILQLAGFALIRRLSQVAEP